MKKGILWLELVAVKMFNSWLYFHLFYKHTKRHKEEMRAIKARVLKRKKEILGGKNE